ncbi:uncharacterized [Tachysurus ichikawai]
MHTSVTCPSPWQAEDPSALILREPEHECGEPEHDVTSAFGSERYRNTEQVNVWNVCVFHSEGELNMSQRFH